MDTLSRKKIICILQKILIKTRLAGNISTHPPFNLQMVSRDTNKCGCRYWEGDHSTFTPMAKRMVPSPFKIQIVNCKKLERTINIENLKGLHE